MRCKTKSFRVGKVRAFQRGRVWYLHYYEAGQRRRPRVGPERAARAAREAAEKAAKWAKSRLRR